MPFRVKVWGSLSMSLIFFHQSRTTLCVAGGQLLTVKVSCLQDKISLLVLEPLMDTP
jgi:hypothetical protein